MIIGPALFAWGLWLLIWDNNPTNDNKGWGIFLCIVGVAWAIRALVEWIIELVKDVDDDHL